MSDLRLPQRHRMPLVDCDAVILVFAFSGFGAAAWGILLETANFAQSATQWVLY